MVKRISISLVISLAMACIAGYIGYALIDVINMKLNLDLSNGLLILLDVCVVALPISIMGFVLVNECLKGFLK
jgi:hypothetical protein